MGRLMRRPGRFSHDFMRRLSPDPSAAPSAALHSCGGRTHRSVLVPVDTTGWNRTTLLSRMRGSAGRPSCECCSYVLDALGPDPRSVVLHLGLGYASATH